MEMYQRMKRPTCVVRIRRELHTVRVALSRLGMLPLMNALALPMETVHLLLGDSNRIHFVVVQEDLD